LSTPGDLWEGTSVAFGGLAAVRLILADPTADWQLSDSDATALVAPAAACPGIGATTFVDPVAPRGIGAFFQQGPRTQGFQCAALAT